MENADEWLKIAVYKTTNIIRITWHVSNDNVIASRETTVKIKARVKEKRQEKWTWITSCDSESVKKFTATTSAALVTVCRPNDTIVY